MITVLRLQSGAEIVGTIIDEDKNTITVNNPLQILYGQRLNGTPAVTLQRFIPFTSQEDLVFKKHSVETTCEPIQGLHEYYENTLKVIQEHVDPSLVTDLLDAVAPKKATSYDVGLAMLEKYMAKKPLN